ncbi:hypothetical protein CWO08_08790 [Vibrio sp. 10N.286.48.B8]|uniref:hypothetical protein n=1 Tax=Vibrio sp. 10N.286.48.B8 TaxID=2056189 RepID=UPI000D35F8A5|nr:hypothetical protein [Vibrio sp. 10N.286.48.B8]PTO96327.1 hypothetical protein CWO08_08790 [Vibrio sp. 10N.286.48.B8]
MAKYENPVRGYIACPVCQSAATTHQVGEGQLIASGEPPKNSRNIGLMYYRCPECGNSSNSKKVTEFIKANSVAELTELKPNPTEKGSVIESDLITEPNLIDVIELTESVQVDEASKDEVSNRKITDTVDDEKTEKTPSKFPFKRVITGLASVIFIVWAVSQLLPKASAEQPQGGEHGAS